MKRKTFNTPFFGASKKSKIAALVFVTASLGASFALAQTTLSTGDVYVTGFNANAPDGFAFVLLRDVAAGTDIRFTDNGFLAAASATASSNARGGENFLRWVAPTGGLTAGTVVTYVNGTGMGSVSSGTVPSITGSTSGLNGLSNSGDQIFIYQGSGAGTSTTTMSFTANSNPTTFNGTILNGLNFQGSATPTTWLTTGTASSNTSYLPTQLNTLNGNTSLAASASRGNYSGARTGLTASAYGYALSNTENWTTASGAGVVTLTATDFTIASSVALHWDANGATANDGGSGTWDTSTQSRFKNGAAGTTFLSWVNSTAGNDHTAVFGGTAGTVSLASGGVTASGLTFDVTGYTIQSNTLTLAGTTPTISVTTAAHSATISSTLASSTGLTKSGAGTLNITGTNATSIGATSVSAGTLAVGVGGTGSLTSAVTVSNAGTKLAGSGSITGNVGVNSGAILAPGNSVGKLTTVGTTTLNTGSIFSWELAATPATTGRGTSYDAVNTTALAGSGAIFQVVLSGSQNFSEAFWTSNRTWSDIFTNVAGDANLSIESVFSGGFQYRNENGMLSAPTALGGFTISGSSLTWTAVPEPSSALAGLLLGAGLLRRRRSA